MRMLKLKLSINVGYFWWNVFAAVRCGWGIFFVADLGAVRREFRVSDAAVGN